MKTKENENNSTPKSDLILKIHNELLIVSKAFDKMFTSELFISWCFSYFDWSKLL